MRSEVSLIDIVVSEPDKSFASKIGSNSVFGQWIAIARDEV